SVTVRPTAPTRPAAPVTRIGLVMFPLIRSTISKVCPVEWDCQRGSLRQLRSSLLRRYIRCVPVRPVLVALPSGALLVLTMRGLGTTKSARQVAYGAERSYAGLDASGQSCCNFL